MPNWTADELATVSLSVSTSGVSLRTIMALQKSGTAYPYFGMFLDNDEKLVYWAREDDGTEQGPSTGVASMGDGETYVFVITNDGTTIRVYIDGVEDHTIAAAGTFTNVDALTFGALVLGSIARGALGETIGDAALFDRVLTPAQVLQLNRELSWPA